MINHDRRAFESLIRPFLELSLHVIPIAGFIPPMRDAEQVLLSPYLKGGSLEAIFTRVHRIDPPTFWTDSRKALLIAGLLSGLLDLHSHGIFHADLKRSDLIVDTVGSLRRHLITGQPSDSGCANYLLTR